MQAAILAGGLGTRLKPITDTIPKCMAEVRGRPFLYYLVNMLKARGISNIVLLTGYLGALIEDYFGDGKVLGLSIAYSREREKLLGTGGALKLAEPILEDVFMVINGDTYLDIDYAGLYNDFTSGGYKGMIVARPCCDGERSDLEIDADMSVASYDKKSRANLGYVNAGVLAFRKEIIAIIEKDRPVSLEEEVSPELARRKEMRAFVAHEPFYDIGTSDNLTTFGKLCKEIPG